MKSLFLLFLATVLSLCHTQAQTNDQDPANLRAKSEHVYMDGVRMKPAKVKKMFAASPEALSQYKSARTISGINLGVSAVAGACIGWELGTYIGGGYIDGIPLAIGGGLLGTVIVLQIITNKKVAKSVALYKDRNKTASVDLHYGFVGSGVGIAMTF